MLYDLLVRVVALENLLIKNKITTNDEINDEVERVSGEMKSQLEKILGSSSTVESIKIKN